MGVGAAKRWTVRGVVHCSTSLTSLGFGVSGNGKKSGSGGASELLGWCDKYG